MVNFKERRENMQKVKRMAAKIIASILNMGLYVEANTILSMTYEIKNTKNNCKITGEQCNDAECSHKLADSTTGNCRRGQGNILHMRW